MKIKLKHFLVFTLLILSVSSVQNCNKPQNQADNKKSGSMNKNSKHKVVIQVSSDDPLTQKIALNNAVNIQKHYGMDEVDIEIVAYGPGLSLLTNESKLADRVSSLTHYNIKLSACGNTIKKIAKKKGKEPVLLEGVKVVSGGVIRLMELQDMGYAYLRP